MKPPVIYKSETGRQAILSVYDSLLARCPVSYETLAIPTCLGKTFAIACGDPGAPPLLLLHGSSANASFWIGDIPDYCRRYRMYALDIPGEPGKSEAARPALDRRAYTLWLGEVLDAFQVEKTAVIGISLGACLAIKFAAAYPQRIEKLVLECPSGVAPQNTAFLFTAALLLHMGRWGKAQILRKINADAVVPQEINDYVCLIAEQFSPRMETIPLFSDADLQRLSMPTLLLVGAKDVFLPSKQTANRLTRLLPRLEARILPDTGHVRAGLSGPQPSFVFGTYIASSPGFLYNDIATKGNCERRRNRC